MSDRDTWKTVVQTEYCAKYLQKDAEACLRKFYHPGKSINGWVSCDISPQYTNQRQTRLCRQVLKDVLGLRCSNIVQSRQGLHMDPKFKKTIN